jgi:hypothetical protein
LDRAAIRKALIAANGNQNANRRAKGNHAIPAASARDQGASIVNDGVDLVVSHGFSLFRFSRYVFGLSGPSAPGLSRRINGPRLIANP